jgi:hypothetical protein
VIVFLSSEFQRCHFPLFLAQPFLTLSPLRTISGNVREVSIEDDSLGTGIPTYHALIDYIITVRREAEQARIQVRKSFQTQHLLQQGFANVELLVLPEEPTSSVLKGKLDGDCSLL